MDWIGYLVFFFFTGYVQDLFSNTIHEWFFYGMKKVGINYSRQKVTNLFRILVTFYRLFYFRLFFYRLKFLPTFFLYRLNLMPTFFMPTNIFADFFYTDFFFADKVCLPNFLYRLFFFIFSTILMFYGLNWIPSFLFWGR